MKYDLVVSDFDGTLGTAPDLIDPSTVIAIKKFIEKGGKFCVCTGRPYQSIKKILTKYGLGGLVGCLQGAQIVDIDTDKEIFSGGFSGLIASKIITSMQNEGLSPCVFVGDALYYHTESKYYSVYKKMGVIQMIRCEDLAKEIKNSDSVFKIACTCGEDKIPALVNKFNSLYGESALFNSGAFEVFECVEKSSHKGKSVDIIANYYNISKDKILCIGDSTNDLELVNGDWFGVAVGDGAKALLNVADEIAPPFNKNPVKYVLEKYCL